MENSTTRGHIHTVKPRHQLLSILASGVAGGILAPFMEASIGLNTVESIGVGLLIGCFMAVLRVTVRRYLG